MMENKMGREEHCESHLHKLKLLTLHLLAIIIFIVCSENAYANNIRLLSDTDRFLRTISYIGGNDPSWISISENDYVQVGALRRNAPPSTLMSSIGSQSFHSSAFVFGQDCRFVIMSAHQLMAQEKFVPQERYFSSDNSDDQSVKISKWHYVGWRRGFIPQSTFIEGAAAERDIALGELEEPALRSAECVEVSIAKTEIIQSLAAREFEVKLARIIHDVSGQRSFWHTRPWRLERV